MEKTKSVIGAEKFEQVGGSRPRISGMTISQLTSRSSGPISFGYSELENNNAAQQASILTDFASQTTPGVDKSNLTLKNELSPEKKVGGWIKNETETGVIDLEVEEAEDISQDATIGRASPILPAKSKTNT